jgi:meso-butanediol dehydrogenase / (S,S)-butanediol dehydrogenase / diacetyl reductase
MPAQFQDKAVLITGTGGGQGRAAALRFAAAGAHVVGCDIKADDNLETARLVRAAGGSIQVMQPVDLSDAGQARDWIEAAAAVHGRIDVLYNNASAAKFAPFEVLSVDDWHWTIRNELDLVFYATRFAWAYLQRQGGVVINTASIAGIAGSGPGGAPHAATKGAVIALTKQLAMEGAPFGIRVVSISPGLIETPATAPLLADPQIREALLGRHLIKRAGVPDDVAGLAVFLAGPDAAFITGANIVVDGGRVAW